MPCGDSRTVQIPLNEAAGQTRALAGEGFAFLIEIDHQVAFAARPGDEAAAQVGNYLILGACNPPLGRRPMTADSSTGLLPPCNVVIRRGTRSRHTAVEVFGPRVVVQLGTGPDMAGTVIDSRPGLVTPASNAADALR